MRVFYFTSSCHRLLKVAGCLFALLTSSLKKACISNLKRSRKQSRSAFCASNKCACQHTSFAAMSLKGAVHPKMKILSAFTHPQVDPNKPVWEDILKNVSWRFIFFPYYGSHWSLSTSLDTHSSKYLILCSPE